MQKFEDEPVSPESKRAHLLGAECVHNPEGRCAEMKAETVEGFSRIAPPLERSTKAFRMSKRTSSVQATGC